MGALIGSLTNIAVATMMLLCVSEAQAVQITYSFPTTIWNVHAGLQDAGINAGDSVDVSFIVDDLAGATGNSTYAYYSGAVVGGTVNIGAQSWTVGGSGENFVAIWNDEPVNAMGRDGFWVQAPLTGPSINGLVPNYIGIVLFSESLGSNNALNSLSLPTSLNLADFGVIAQGAVGFGQGVPSSLFNLYVESVSVATAQVIPEPSTLALFMLALAILMIGRFTAGLKARKQAV